MTVIDETFMECPWYGSRQMARHLRFAGHEIGCRRARRLMAKMGLTPIYQRPHTSDPHPQHRVYPSPPRQRRHWHHQITREGSEPTMEEERAFLSANPIFGSCAPTRELIVRDDVEPSRIPAEVWEDFDIVGDNLVSWWRDDDEDPHEWGILGTWGDYLWLK